MRSLLNWIVAPSHRFQVFCTIIVLFAFFTRLVRVSWPPTYYFDEVYHAFTARTYLHNDPKGYEYWQTPPQGVAYEWTHPPLAKLLMAFSMLIFGENSFGWRISSVLAGTGVVIMTGYLAHKLFGNKLVTLLTLLLISFDNLLLVMSRLAMNDMHFLFFALVAIAFYLEMKEALLVKKPNANRGIACFIAATIALSLSLASKWTAIYVGGGLILDFLLSLALARRLPPLKFWGGVVIGALLLPLIYLGTYAQFFLQGHTFKQLIETTQQMWWYHTNLKATHPYQSVPLQWIVDLRPVWLHVDYSKINDGLIANIFNTDNPLILWFGLAAALIFLAYMGLRLLGAKLSSANNHPIMTPLQERSLATTLIFYFILWLPWIASPRIMFFYHYAPAVPFLVILLALFLATAWKEQRAARLGIGVLTAVIFLVFVAIYPMSTGIFVPQGYYNTIFSLFPSWK